MKFTGLVGSAYKLKSVNVDCQNLVNAYVEKVESGLGKEGNTVYLRHTPGLVTQFEVGTGPIRLIYPMQMTQAVPELPTNKVLIVSGNQLYTATYNGTSWTSAAVGDPLETSEGAVYCANSSYMEPPVITGKGFGATIVDGKRAYNYLISVALGVLTETLLNTGPFVPFLKPSHVVLLDGFFIYNTVDSGQFYVSEWNSAIVNATSFASSEGDPDNILAMISLNRQLWLFNERSTEVWANTGNADFPFERIQGGFIEKGCVAGASVAKIEGNVFWLGRDANGEGQVFRASGLSNYARISTHAIEQAISGYADISTARGYTYQFEGHPFYVLCFDEATWVYDLSTGEWHQRAYTNTGTLERHRGICGAFFPEYSMHLVGDHTSGKVYMFDDEIYTDDGNAITRQRTTPHLSGSLNRVFHKRLILDMETGIGLDGDVQGSDPQIMMQFSNDGGHTWSNEMWASAGKKVGGIGDFKKRVIWNRLGSARDRVYRFTMTDPVPFRILGAEIDVEVGGS